MPPDFSLVWSVYFLCRPATIRGTTARCRGNSNISKRKTPRQPPPPLHRDRGPHALRRVARTRYLSNAKKITHVISARPINNVLWPHRATIPSIFQSPEFTRLVNRRSSPAAHVLYGGGTVHIQVQIKHVAGLKTVISSHLARKTPRPADAEILTFHLRSE